MSTYAPVRSKPLTVIIPDEARERESLMRPERFVSSTDGNPTRKELRRARAIAKGKTPSLNR